MSKKNQDKTPDELRDSLLAAALEHVAFDGWGSTTMKRAAEDVGVDVGIVDLAFPRGAIDMIDLQAQQADIAMLEAGMVRSKNTSEILVSSICDKWLLIYI